MEGNRVYQTMLRLLGLLVPAVCAAAQTVEGSVFDAATGAGVAGVKVELLKGGTPFYERTTEGGGRFRFDNVREGEYAARYQSADYFLTAGPSDYRYFLVKSGDPVKLEVRMLPYSKISGRVIDAEGSGVPKAVIEISAYGMVANGRAYRRTTTGGGGGAALSDRPLEMTLESVTDDRGLFEAGLMPGSILISVRPPPSLKPPAREPDGPELVWRRTYYPGVALREAASRIELLPGASISGVEVKLAAAPAHAVRGVVTDVDGTPARRGGVLMGAPLSAQSAKCKSDGTFEFPAVPEGENSYMVTVGATPGRPEGFITRRAAGWIEVPRHDIENWKIRLDAPVKLRGRVVMEKPKEAPTPRANPITLVLRGAHERTSDLEFLAGSPILPGPDNRISVDLFPGLYGVGPMLQPADPPYYLDSILVGGQDLLRQDVEIASDSEMTVIYRTDGGSVSGKAENCFSGGVLLVPADPALRGRGLSRAGACDAGDRYEIQAVRPGGYYALAFAGNGPVLAVDDKLLEGAVKVTVRSNEGTTADLRAVTKPIY